MTFDSALKSVKGLSIRKCKKMYTQTNINLNRMLQNLDEAVRFLHVLETNE